MNLTTPPRPLSGQTPISGSNEEAALLAELERVVERRALMQFGPERRAHFVSVVASRARAGAFPDISAYVRRVIAPGVDAELFALIDELTINETTFFRNVPQLDLFAKVVVPEIVARKRATAGPKRVSVWSAACSTGQEVYTLGILATEAVRFLPAWAVQVFGTDISPTVLETARRGVYPKARLDAVPPPILPRYFEDLGEQIKVRDALRRLASFQQHNLKDSFPPGVFDVIFCRNVMIYFSREEQARLAARFRERLAPDGCLFIGHSESLQGLADGYRLRIHDRGICYQKEG